MFIGLSRQSLNEDVNCLFYKGFTSALRSNSGPVFPYHKG